MKTTTMPDCVNDCGRAAVHGRKGWCRACYTRWYRAGRPDTDPPPVRHPCSQDAAIAAREDYGWLRDVDTDPLTAAARAGITPNTALRYERDRGAIGHRRAPVPQHPPTITCTCCGRTGPAGHHGWVRACYVRWLRAGRPADGPPAPRAPGRKPRRAAV